MTCSYLADAFIQVCELPGNPTRMTLLFPKPFEKPEPAHCFCNVYFFIVLRWPLLTPFDLLCEQPLAFHDQQWTSCSSGSLRGHDPQMAADLGYVPPNGQRLVRGRGIVKAKNKNSDCAPTLLFFSVAGTQPPDTNNGAHWLPFIEAGGEKWATANPRLCKSIRR